MSEVCFVLVQKIARCACRKDDSPVTSACPISHLDSQNMPEQNGQGKRVLPFRGGARVLILGGGAESEIAYSIAYSIVIREVTVGPRETRPAKKWLYCLD